MGGWPNLIGQSVLLTEIASLSSSDHHMFLRGWKASAGECGPAHRRPPHPAADAWRVLSVLRACPVPCIALAMGERGQISRLLAPKYGGFLTFGALSPERASGEQQGRLGLGGLYKSRKWPALLG